MPQNVRDTATKLLALIGAPAGAVHVMVRSIDGRKSLVVRFSRGYRRPASLPSEMDGIPVKYEIAGPAVPHRATA